MLQFGRDSLDYNRLLKAVVEALNYDSKDKVKAIALECLAVMSFKLGSHEFQALLSRNHTSDAVRSQIQGRLSNPALPTATVDGVVEHSVDLPSASVDSMDSSILDAGVARQRQGSSFAPAGGWAYDMPGCLPYVKN